MINLLRGEFYKLRKSKCVYICGIVMIVFVLFLYGTLYLADRIQQGEMENGSYGFFVSEELEGKDGQEPLSVWDTVGILDVEQQMFSNFAWIILTVFSSVFVIGEYGNGTVKNMVGKGYERWKIFLAKYIATTVTAILMLLIMAGATLILGTIFRGTDGLNREFYQNLCSYTGIQILFGAVLIGIVIAVSEVCRNLGAGIAISIGIISFSSLITAGLDLVFHKWNFKPSDYWITDLIVNCPVTDIDKNFLIRAVITSVVWIVLIFGMGVLHFGKADVK